MMFFSKWLEHSPSSGPGHVPIAQVLAHAAKHMVQHRLVLLSASNFYWCDNGVLCLYAFKMYLFAYGWCSTAVVLTHFHFPR